MRFVIDLGRHNSVQTTNTFLQNVTNIEKYYQHCGLSLRHIIVQQLTTIPVEGITQTVSVQCEVNKV